MPTTGANRVAALQILKHALNFVTAFAAGVKDAAPARHASIGQVLGPSGVLGACDFVAHCHSSRIGQTRRSINPAQPIYKMSKIRQKWLYTADGLTCI
jgi:hypothetical protein